MGLFNHFKKGKNMFDKNIEPKCAYCEHGKPARSEGKILCQKCGIVEKDFSCKKFSYSPFLRIPERETPAPQSALQPESSANESISSVQQNTASDIVNDNAAPVQAKQQISETNTSGIQPKQPNADVNNSSAENINISEVQPEQNKNEAYKADISEQDKKTDTKPVAKTEPVEAADTKHSTPEPKHESFQYISSEQDIKKEVTSNNKALKISGINNTVSDNSEKIAQLNSIPKAAVSSIENSVQPKKIVLPEVSSDNVSSIHNKPEKNHNIEYLETIHTGTVSSLENHGRTVHRLPEGTAKATVNDI